MEDLLEVNGVVDVRETLTGHRNVYAVAVGTSSIDVTRITDSIHDLGLEIERSEILNGHWIQPFDDFHQDDSHEDAGKK